jgi:hypothetical protein
LPDRTVRPDSATGATATMIFRNWLNYLSKEVQPIAPSIDPGAQR